VITHLGSPHDAGFENRKHKAQEKIKLCRNSDVVIAPKDIEALQSELSSLKKNQPLTKIISWGYNDGATFRLLKVERTNLGQKIHFQNRGTAHFIEIPFIDEASIANAMTCFCVLFAFERWDEKHIDLFKQLKPVNNRLTIEKGRRGNVILNDSYSNDFESLAIALDVIQRQQPNLPLKLIVSEMEQVSNNVHLEQQKIAQLFESKHIDSIIYLGTELPIFLNKFHVLHFTDTLSLIQSGCLNLISNAAVLVKGARKYQLEQVVEHLKERLHKTSLEIDLDAIKHNFRYFKRKISPNTKMMCMVKAFGYGSGTFEVSKTLQDLGADYLGVAFADEGVLLREAGIKVPIMVMNTDAQTMNLLNQYFLEPVVYSADNLNEYMNLLGTAHGEIHLEIDTGMHRLGFGVTEIIESVKHIPANIKVKSIFTHLAVSEDASKDSFTEVQSKLFYETVSIIESILGYTVIKHISNTGGIQRFAHLQSDMVRLGIGLYGLMPDGSENNDLQTVATLSSTITQIHTVLPFEGIGYGQHDSDPTERRIATIAMGYADGLSRRFGKKVGGVLINGIFAPFVGNICMDMAMVDVTEIDCQEGDSVEIFGKNLSINEMSHRGGTISYEILTNISQRVPRIYLGEN
jgi:alanine racemase